MSMELPAKSSESFIDHEGSSDDDNEAKISEYLTLAQRGNILRELAVKGKTNFIYSLDRTLGSEIRRTSSWLS